MSFSGSEHYEAGVETVFAFLSNPDAIKARFEAAGDADVEIVRCEADGDAFVIEVTRVVTVDLPSFAKRVLKPKNAMRQIDRWDPPAADGSRQGTYTIDVSGAPLKTSGTHDLHQDDTGTKHQVTGEIEVKVPIVGKKIGGFASGTAEERLKTDFAYNKARLDED
jgi:carbon monoxide dehydrogenase subunit G